MAQNERYLAAPVDEKNVCSDWLEMVFDDYNYTYTEKRHKNKYCGYVRSNLVECSYTFGDNVIRWQIFATGGDLEETKTELKRIFAEIDKENTGLICNYAEEENILYQSFYWDISEN